MAQVHPTAVVGDGVELGERVTIGPNAVVLGPCRIGDDCWIGPGCVIGTPPEISSLPHNRAWDGELAHLGVEIGARTVVRELSTIHQGSHRPTRIGSDCWLLNRVYVAHDGQVGDQVTVSAGVSMGGHVVVGDRVNIGMNAVVHQRRVIGPGAMVGMGAAVTRDVPPFAKAFGTPVRLRGVNAVGMVRAGVGEDAVRALDAAYAELRMPESVPANLADAFAWWAAAEPARPLVPVAARA
ncbi:DapH/DapD/GlmU-related protein [Streptoalloteichus tenebrarius]|uniref:DapH/DapD/GlmU-related protein n=1 Tax=Streptoalloteichus tenebrarius (strain ATCC 17920 / DSM 40477 / JCM 4838 / CBS 697.72 / NBRC 16177 / NCIMB 11028 / NRRL B-12390 / A12253. 1 / ISP 5477) TaxID=1933 RepID=UPI0020A50F5D|nr:DapH/DapD/GlmU-related protein [Streptoalloteichus tenebrarius]BFF01808.1 UDP-N-acetylglucosamine acyltransferase [Streptoalloteichus tenebrarius]